MAAASKRREKKSNNAKARGKCATSAQETRRKQADEGGRSYSRGIENNVAEMDIIRRPRMELADALRACGVDERGLAKLYKHVFRRVKKFISKESDPKRSLDNLKELSRVLESKRTNDRAGERGEAQVLVQLVHQVARPERGMEALAAVPRKGGRGEAHERAHSALESFAPEMCAIDVCTGEAHAENNFDVRD